MLILWTEEILHQLKGGFPIICRLSSIPGGARFRNHQRGIERPRVWYLLPTRSALRLVAWMVKDALQRGTSDRFTGTRYERHCYETWPIDATDSF